jgi:hypothetical protein
MDQARHRWPVAGAGRLRTWCGVSATVLNGAKPCVTHVHKWAGYNERYVREQTCRRHYYHRIDAKGLSEELDACRECGLAR